MGHDVDHGGAGDGSGESGGNADSADGLQLLTVRSLAAAIAFFGIAGRSVLALDLGVVLATLTGVAAGLAAATAVAAAMRQLRNLESDGVVRIEGAVGRSGQVHVRVPADAGAGAGRILLTLQNRLVELPAVTLDGELPSGTPVTVVGLSDPETLEVVRTPIQEIEMSVLPVHAALALQSSPLEQQLGALTWPAIGAAVAAVILVSLLMLFVSRYKRCPANQLLVISGKVGGRQLRAVHPRRRRLRVAASSRTADYLSWSRSRSTSRSRTRSPWRTSASTCRACSPWPSAPSPRCGRTPPSAC